MKVKCNILKVASCYLLGGLSIVPLKRGSKKPSIKWKDYQDRYMNLELVNDFFTNSNNLAIVTGKISHLTVIDVDDIDKFREFYDFETLTEKAKTIVKSPKGYHFYFLYESTLITMQIRNYGFDIKNDGGLITAPPSRIGEHEYYFLKSEGLGEIPEDFKKKIRSLTEKSSSEDSILKEVLSKVREARKLSDGKYRGVCPAHDDNNPSLDIEVKDGKLRVHCWAGCSEEEVLRALGFERKTKKEKKDSATERLLEIASSFECWVNQNGEEFVSVDIRGEIENLRIESREFRKILQTMFFKKYGKPIHTQALTEVIQTLAGLALTEGERYQTYVRIGKTDESIEIDLSRGKVIRITEKEILLTDPTCKFIRPSSMIPLPNPDLNVEKKDWKLIAKFLNTNNEGIVLSLAWLLGCFNIDGEFPILNIVGEREGIGKTTATKLLKSIIDPSVVLVKPLPKAEDDLLTVCLHNHVVAFDNISFLTGIISDALCRISTGAGIAKRRLFTDVDAVLYFVKNPVILNGIDLFAERRDLRRRCIHIELQRLKNPSPINQLEREFKEVHPKILGWLIKAVQFALKEKLPENIELTDMASFVEFICRSEKWFPLTSVEFVCLFKENRQKVSIQVAQENPVVKLILELSEPGEWQGTVTELYEILVQKYQNTAMRGQIPKNVKSLGKKLRRLLSDLENFGIEVEFLKDRTSRTVRIKKLSENNVSLVTMSQTEANQKVCCDISETKVDKEEFFSSNNICSIAKACDNSDNSDNRNNNFFEVIDGSQIDPDDIEVISES